MEKANGLKSMLGSTWNTAADNTSIAGASNAARSSHPLRKSCWICIFLLFLTLTIFGVWTVVADYLRFPVDTTVALEHQDQVPFPAVTVCNLNRVKCQTVMEIVANCTTADTSCPIQNSSVEIMEEIQELACPENIEESGASEETTTERAIDGGGLLLRKKRGLLGSIVSGVVDGLNNGIFSNVDTELGGQPEEVDKEYEFLVKYLSLSTDERMLIGHSFGEFVKSCTFRQKNCLDPSLFKTSTNPSFGNCFTFNSELNENDTEGGRRVSSMSGPSFGLSLVLNLDQRNYMQEGQSPKAGARVSVHGPSRLPLMDEFGYDVMPNTNTGLSMQEVSISRQKHPYPANCSDGWRSGNYTKAFPTEIFNYSEALCQRVCLQSTFQEDCICSHPLYLDHNNQKMNFDPCDLRDGIITEIDQGMWSCPCNLQCREIDYKLTFSQSTWPADYHKAKAAEKFGFSSGSDDEVSRNLVKTQFYFTSLNVQRVEESPRYMFEDGSLISALGGALSLYLGISIASAFEVIEFLIDIVVNLCSFLVTTKRPKK